MLELIFLYESCAKRAIEAGVSIAKICELPVHEQLGRAKAVSSETFRKEFEKTAEAIKSQIDTLIAEANG